MKTIIRNICLLLWVFALAGVHAAGAENRRPLREQRMLSAERGSSYESLNQMKVEIEQLLQENKSLLEQNSSLQNRINELQSEVQARKQEIEKIKPAFYKSRAFERKKVRSPDGLRRGLEELENDIMITQSRNTYLKGSLLEYDEKQRLAQLKLKDVKLQQQSLEMDYKVKQASLKNAGRDQEIKRSNLQSRLKSRLENEKKVLEAIGAMEDEVSSYSIKLQRLRKENIELESTILELERKKDFQSRETSLLKNKEIIEQKRKAGLISLKKQQKTELEEEIQLLETQYNELDVKVARLLSDRSDRQKYMKDMIKVDKENQDLRDRIANLKDKLKKLDQ